MRLVRMEDTWQLCSAPEYADLIRRAFEIRKPAKLSQPALEVLTIIAYYQPTTRAYVDQIRGVDSAYTVGLLLDRHLIEECGTPAGAGTAPAVPHHQGVSPGVPPELRWRICRRCQAWRPTGSCGWNDDGAVQESEQ